MDRMASRPDLLVEYSVLTRDLSQQVVISQECGAVVGTTSVVYAESEPDDPIAIV